MYVNTDVYVTGQSIVHRVIDRPFDYVRLQYPSAVHIGFRYVYAMNE